MTRARRIAHAGAIVVTAGLALSAGPVAAQAAPLGQPLTFSSQLDVLATNRDTLGLNRNYRLDSPWSQIRLRIFLQHWLSDRIGVFSELLFDIGAAPRVNGAYVVVNQILGQPWLNTRIGLAPSPMGNYALRETYFGANPLIGNPLPWQHRTTFDGTGLATNQDLIRRRTSNVLGMPPLYVNCWDVQWELLGQAGPFEYSAAVTSGSISNPTLSTDENGVAWMSRIGLEPVSGIRFGVSAGMGPYIGGPQRDPLTIGKALPAGTGPEDFAERVAGYDLEVSRDKIRLYSEGFVADWEAPLVTGKLSLWSGYGELDWDFLPGWTAATRGGAMRFNKISTTNNGLGPESGWDDDVFQVESALSYRITRELMIRGDWQHTTFQTGTDKNVDLYGLQLRAVF